MPKGKKSPHSNEDSAQPKIHKFKPKIKLLKKKKNTSAVLLQPNESG